MDFKGNIAGLITEIEPMEMNIPLSLLVQKSHRPIAHQCYENALVVFNSQKWKNEAGKAGININGDLRYVEGIAIVREPATAIGAMFPIEHGWIEYKGEVIETTFDVLGMIKSGEDMPLYYPGIVMGDVGEILDEIGRSDYYSLPLFYNNPNFRDMFGRGLGMADALYSANKKAFGKRAADMLVDTWQINHDLFHGVTARQRITALFLRDELLAKRLTVSLIPSKQDDIARTGGKIRAVESRNPKWYREFCRAYSANRTKPRNRKKHDTKIKRNHTLRALQEIVEGRCKTVYAERLLPFIDDEADKLEGMTEKQLTERIMSNE